MSSSISPGIAMQEVTTATEITLSVMDEIAPPQAVFNARPQFDRMKGAKWFTKARDQNIVVIGQGGIGSWLTLLLSRLGCVIHTYDMDRYETHNMTGQLVRTTDIGKYKTTAVAEICRLFNESPQIYTNGEYTAESYGSNVTMCALDNMASRRIAFSSWKRDVELAAKDTFPYNSQYLFMDGRLLAEQFQILTVPGDRADLIDRYEKEYLFDDAQTLDEDCTFKQTSHCAAMIASHMVGFFTNWITNIQTGDPEYSKLPFFYEYVIPFNMTMLK